MVVALVSRWARGYVGFAVCCLVGAHVAVLANAPERVVITLVLFGFVLHVVFGKAYSLVPSYFDRELRAPGTIRVQLPLTGVGALLLAADGFRGVPDIVGQGGAVLWTVGVLAFLGSIAVTIRGNPTGAETATGSGKEHLAGLDRVANAFVPFALLYLLAGTYATLVGQDVAPAVLSSLSPIFDGYPPRTTHLLGTGTAALLLFALGARLFPRFLVVDPPRSLFATALICGAVGPAALAATLPVGEWFGLAAAIETIAVVAYALGYAVVFHRSDRERVVFWGVLAGAGFGVVAVAIGALFAVDGVTAPLLAAHRRVTLLGFLGLTIASVAMQFYPPTVGQWRWCSNRTAALSLGAFASGVVLQTLGLAVSVEMLAMAGASIGLLGLVGYGYLLAAAFATR